MPLPFAAQVGIQFGLGAFLTYLGRRREKDPVEHSDLRVYDFKTGRSTYPAQYCIGATRVIGVEVYRGVELINEQERENLPAGIGRRMHRAFALSRGSLNKLIGCLVDGILIEFDAPSETLSDGGMVYGGENVYGGSTSPLIKVVANFKGDGTQGMSLRSAVPRMDGGNPLPWGEDQRGEDVSWVHVTYVNPPYGDNEKTGVELRKVWDGIPDIEFIVEGMDLPIPKRNTDQSNWVRAYTNSAAAARYWFLRERMGVGEQAFRVNNVYASHVSCSAQIDLTPPESWTGDSARIRCAYRASVRRFKGSDAPTLPTGNSFPPDNGWSSTRVQPTQERKYVWACYSVLQYDGTWSDWIYIKNPSPILTYKGSASNPQLAPNNQLAMVSQAYGAGDMDIHIPVIDPEDIVPGSGLGPDGTINVDVPPGILPGDIDPCDPEDGLLMSARNDSVFSRYGVGCVIYSDDNPESIYRELDFAWAGIVARDGGQLRFLPGMDYKVVATFNKDNSELVSARPAPRISERVNSITTTLVESKQHRWGEYQTNPIRDEFLIERWGIELSKDIGKSAFVQPSFTAMYLLGYKWLRAAGYDSRYTLKSVIGNEAEFLNVKIGDRVYVDYPNYGLSESTRPNLTVGLPELRVESKRVNTQTGELYFDVVYHPSEAIYRDDIGFAPNRLDASEPGGFIPIPTGLEVEETAVVGVDGTLRIALIVKWMKAAVDSTEIRHRIHVPAGQTFVEIVDGTPTNRVGPYDGPWRSTSNISADSTTILNLDVGVRVDVQARHYNSLYFGERRERVYGEWSSSASRTITGSGLGPGDPTGLSAISRVGFYRVSWNSPTEKDYAYTEVWELQGQSSNPVPTAQAKLVARSPIGTYVGDFPVDTSNDIAIEGTIWIRHVNASGKKSKNYARISVTQNPYTMVAGATWRQGNGVPKAALGDVGDFYLRIDVPEIYEKTATGWVRRADLTGADASTWYTGTSAPTDAIGKEGDWYLQTGTDAAEMWRKGPAKAGTDWIKIFDIDETLDGTVWHAGDTYPASDLGSVGDFYFLLKEVTESGTTYGKGSTFEKTDETTWTYRIDLTGPQGSWS